jgi:hypothetical protein
VGFYVSQFKKSVTLRFINGAVLYSIGTTDAVKENVDRPSGL